MSHPIQETSELLSREAMGKKIFVKERTKHLARGSADGEEKAAEGTGRGELGALPKRSKEALVGKESSKEELESGLGAEGVGEEEEDEVTDLVEAHPGPRN